MVKNVNDTTKARAITISIEKYRGRPYWSIWLGEELLAVTVYKKGAVAIKDLLTEIGDSACA